MACAMSVSVRSTQRKLDDQFLGDGANASHCSAACEAAYFFGSCRPVRPA